MLADIERDLILMSLVIFLPTLFALVVLCLPRGSEEWMRWVSLFGTAATLVVSLFLFIDYFAMFEGKGIERDGRPSARSLLEPRAEEAENHRSAVAPQDSRDMLARLRWIPRFN